MKTAIKPNRSALLAGAALALAAMGFTGAVQARDNVQWSVGVGVPGAVVNVGNVGSVYPQPVYVQPAPIYVRPRPVFVQPAPVYVQPQPIYYGPPGYRHRGGYYQQAPQGYGYGYGPVYHQRGGWQGGGRDHHWRDEGHRHRHGERH